MILFHVNILKMSVLNRLFLKLPFRYLSADGELKGFCVHSLFSAVNLMHAMVMMTMMMMTMMMMMMMMMISKYLQCAGIPVMILLLGTEDAGIK